MWGITPPPLLIWIRKFKFTCIEFLKPGTLQICFSVGAAHLQSFLQGDSVRSTHLQISYFVLVSKNHFESCNHLLTIAMLCVWQPTCCLIMSFYNYPFHGRLVHEYSSRHITEVQWETPAPLTHQWECQSLMSNGPANHKWSFLWLIHTQSCFISLVPPRCPPCPFLQRSQGLRWKWKHCARVQGGCLIRSPLDLCSVVPITPLPRPCLSSEDLKVLKSTDYESSCRPGIWGRLVQSWRN